MSFAPNSVCKCERLNRIQFAPQSSARANPQRTTDCYPRSLAISGCRPITRASSARVPAERAMLGCLIAIRSRSQISTTFPIADRSLSGVPFYLSQSIAQSKFPVPLKFLKISPSANFQSKTHILGSKISHIAKKLALILYLKLRN